MINRLSRLLVPILLLAALCGTTAAQAQDTRKYTLGILGGIGGTSDVDYTNFAYQLSWSLVTDVRTHFGIRAGQILTSNNEITGEIAGADLTYITFAGEYRLTENFYESGIYLGLGLYSMDGRSVVGNTSLTDEGVGVTLGITGEFDVSKKIAILIEFAGHFAQLENADAWFNGLAGIAVRF